MPIWLRLFTFNQLKEHYDKKKEAEENLQNQLANKNPKELAQPNIPQATYTSKTPKN